MTNDDDKSKKREKLSADELIKQQNEQVQAMDPVIRGLLLYGGSDPELLDAKDKLVKHLEEAMKTDEGKEIMKQIKRDRRQLNDTLR